MIRIHFTIQILIVLLMIIKLLLMEQMIQKSLIWNSTNIVYPQFTINKTENRNKDNVKNFTANVKNQSRFKIGNFNEFHTNLVKYLYINNSSSDKYVQIMPPLTKVNTANDSIYRRRVNTNANSSTRSTTTKIPPYLTKPKSNRNHFNVTSIINETQKITNPLNHRSTDRTMHKRLLKNCENNCDDLWTPSLENTQYPMADRDNSLTNNINYNYNTQQYPIFTEHPLLTRLKPYMKDNKNDESLNNNNEVNSSRYYNDCGNSTYGNQSCNVNLYDFRTDGDTIDRAYHTNNNNRYHYNNEEKESFYNYDKSKHHNSYDHTEKYNNYQLNDDNEQPVQTFDDFGNMYLSDNDDNNDYINNNAVGYPVNNQQYTTDGENYRDVDNDVQHHDNNHYSHDSTSTGYQYDTPKHHNHDFKWESIEDTQHDSDIDNNYDDERALTKIKDMYYCSKYCHCCKKSNVYVKVKYTKHGILGKLLKALKYFGFDSGYNFFYGGRSLNNRDDKYNPFSYFKEPYYGKSDYHHIPKRYYDSDEVFAFFNEEYGVPEGLTDCEDVCTCCEDNRRQKLKEKLDKKKKDENKIKKKFQGLSGIMRYLIFSNDDGTVDVIDDDDDKKNKKKRKKARGRSYEANFVHNPLNTINDYKNRLFGTNKKYSPINNNYDGHRYGTSDTQKYDFKDRKYESHHQAYEPETHWHDSDEHDIHHHEDLHEVEHHHEPFDCSKCCRFCKKKPAAEKRKKRKRKKKRKGPGGLFDFLRDLFTGAPIEYDDYADGDDKDSPNFPDVSLTGGSDYAYIDNYYEPGSISIPSSSNSTNTTCCFNSTTATTLVAVVTISIIILNAFSPVNVITIIIVPMIFFGLLVIFIILLLQAIVPVYFIPIFIIILIVSLIPILLLVLLFFLSLPMFLFPVFFPFILRLPGTLAPNTNVVSTINCIGQGNSSVNCSLDSTIPIASTTANTLLDSTGSIDYVTINDITETTTSVIDYETILNNTEIPTIEEQIRVPKSLYWKINSVLGSENCLERAGCHLAIYTHSLNAYNRMIFRILENISLSLDESKFTAYKDAYQIGSLNVTNHEKCATLYYCTKLEKYIKL